MEATKAEAHHLAVVLNEACSPDEPWTETKVLDDMDGGATWMMGVYAEHPVAALRMAPVEEEHMELTELGVLPIYRREGLGRELVMESINWCAIRRKKSLSLNRPDEPGVAGLFESLQFRRAGDSEPGRLIRILAR